MILSCRPLKAPLETKDSLSSVKQIITRFLYKDKLKFSKRVILLSVRYKLWIFSTQSGCKRVVIKEIEVNYLDVSLIVLPQWGSVAAKPCIRCTSKAFLRMNFMINVDMFNSERTTANDSNQTKSFTSNLIIVYNPNIHNILVSDWHGIWTNVYFGNNMLSSFH